jgi:hypothetical protein
VTGRALTSGGRNKQVMVLGVSERPSKLGGQILRVQAVFPSAGFRFGMLDMNLHLLGRGLLRHWMVS